MPHVTGHFCVCHVELWLLFHDFFPCTPVYRVPGYWAENTPVPRCLGAQTHHCTQNPVSHPENLLIHQKSENSYSTRKVAGKSSEKARKFQQNAFLGSRRHWVLGTGYWVLGTGYWVLGTGYWVLGTGYWVLGTGYWAPRESTLKAAKAQVTGKTRYVIMFNFQLLVKIEQKNAACFNLFVFSTRNKRVTFTLLNSYFFTHQSFCVTS